MAKEENHTKRNLAVGTAIAGLTGYLVGVLTAPKSGKETRADIMSRADEVKASAAAELAALQVELKDKIAEAKNHASTLKGKALDEFNEAVAKAKDAQAKAAAVLKAVKAGEAEDPELNKAIKQAKQAVKNLSSYIKS